MSLNDDDMDLNTQVNYRLIEKLSEANQALVEDIAKRKEVELALSKSEKKYRVLFESSADAHLVMQDGAIIEANPAALKLFRRDNLDQLLGQNLLKFSPSYQADGRSSKTKWRQLEKQLRQQNSLRTEWQIEESGTSVPTELLMTRIETDQGFVLHIVCHDISDRHKAEQEAYRRANFDELTGLPNRRLFIERLQHSLEAAKKSGEKLGLLFIDLDRFKTINDSLGHAAGDQLLKIFAMRCSGLLRDGDTLARLGGDEFVVIVEHLSNDYNQASKIANQIAGQLLRSSFSPIQLDVGSCHITASIGVTVFPLADESCDDILSKADMAMYLAKTEGRNGVRFFHQALQEQAEERVLLERDLRTALIHDELDLVYQPKFDAQFNLLGVEVLSRWLHPELGSICPNLFISIAEESGMINDLGNRVLNRAVEEVQDLNRSLGLDLTLSVNVSPRQFENPDFFKSVQNTIEHYKIAAGFLTFEITENTFMKNLDEMTERIKRIKACGIEMALDDFGTGFSSLSYLKQLPIEELKIDHDFIRSIETDADNAMLVKSIVSIAKHFNLRLVAEGVENRQQLTFLQALEVDVFQGYLLAEPMTAAALIDFVQTKADLAVRAEQRLLP